MNAFAIRDVSVWLDDMAPTRGAFAHALEWASKLRLPLHGITSGLKTRSHLGSAQHSRSVYPLSEAGDFGAPIDLVDACAHACFRAGVRWDTDQDLKQKGVAIDSVPQSTELCVVGEALPALLRERLLHYSLETLQTVLVSPRTWRSASRALLVHRGDPAGRFLRNAADVCYAIGIPAIVLTVARSEIEARRLQHQAERVVASYELPFDFDFIVGCDVRTAVASVARWRRCSHVFVGKRDSASWWRWLRRNTLEQLLGLSESFTFLALPVSSGPEPPCGGRSNA